MKPSLFPDFSYVAFLVLLVLETSGQAFKRPEINPEDFIQKLAPVQPEGVEDEEFYESLFQFYQEPLDINTAGADEWRSLYLLPELLINNLLKHRALHGDFLSLYELQSVAGFDLPVIRSLLPFIVLKERVRKEEFKGIWRNAGENYLLFRAERTLETARGFSEDKYAGSRNKLYARYRLSRPKDYSFGFICEKDAGEKSILDYYTFHAQVQHKGRIKNLVLGDYLVQFGQGLVFSAGFAAGKGAESVYSTRRSNLGIRPYNSLVESGGFRGGAITLKAGKLEFTALYSNRRKDATVAEVEEDDTGQVFSALLASGLHRTPAEITRKHAIHEQQAGGNVLYRRNGLQWGLNVLYTRFGAAFLRRELPYNRFEFEGNSNLLAGTHVTFSWQNFNFFGEMARSSSGGIGVTGGWVASLHPQLEWALNLRRYDRDFHSFYGAAFGENSRNINESGIYNGLKYIPKKGLVVSAFYDRFRFPWLRYLVDAPSSGHSYLLRVSYQPSKKVLTYAQYFGEQKQKNQPDNTGHTDFLLGVYRQTMMYTFDYTPQKTLRLQSRVQHNRHRYEGAPGSGGLAFIQDVESTLKRVQLRTRLAWFKTDYDTRVYAFENDVLSAVSFPAYNGAGFRWYLIARLAAGRHLDLWVRVSQTRVSDREALGSGTDTLDKPQKTDLKVQVRYKL